jgi:hypothetical protein
VLFAVLAAVAVLVAFRAWRKWRANAYRRAALRELAAGESVAAMAEILKRTALVAYPRTDVASLSGPAWLAWLAETGGRQVPTAVSQALTVGVFGDGESANVSQLAAFAAEWIRSHESGRSVGEGS